MTVHFTNHNGTIIHLFSDYQKGWIIESAGIDKCSLCGKASFRPRIQKDIYKLMTKSRRYTICRGVQND